MYLLDQASLMMEPNLHEHKVQMKFSPEIVEDILTLVEENCAFPLANSVQTVSRI